jgi:hypothetical protein
MIIAPESAAYSAALEIMDIGWCPIPLRPGTKTPMVGGFTKWRRRPPASAIDRWFSKWPDCGLGVVLGRVSGSDGTCLCCRDFDIMEAFQKWAERHPELAATLPRTKSRRGFHVYFLATEAEIRRATPNGKLTYHGADGEFKANGFTVLPPSVHETGFIYTWAIPPTDIPLIGDLRQAGLIPPPKPRDKKPTAPSERGVNTSNPPAARAPPSGL